MARECIGCLYDQPMDGSAHHREDWGDGTYYRVVCTRGPIERELREYAVDEEWWTLERYLQLRGETLLLMQGVSNDRRRRGYPPKRNSREWYDDGVDRLSEAIEAAAELGL